MKLLTSIASLSLAIALANGGCENFNREARGDARDTSARQHDAHAGEKTGKAATASLKPSAQATTQPAMNNVTGTLTFTELSGNRVHITGEVRNLPPNSEHGFHIHEKGDLNSPDYSSAGPHFNPTGAKHGGVHSGPRHAGDLGNIRSDSNGVAKVDVVAESVTLEGEHAIVGRSVVVHAQRDDLKTDPAGDSGARISAGVIEMKR